MPSPRRPRPASPAPKPGVPAKAKAKPKANAQPKAKAKAKPMAARTSKAKPAPKAKAAPKAARAAKAKRSTPPKATVARRASPPGAAKATPPAARTKAPASPAVEASLPVVTPSPAPQAPVVAAPPVESLPVPTGPLSSEDLLARVVALVRERRGEDIVALDVRGLADYMDYMVICTGRSERQNRAIADGLMRGLRGLKVRPVQRPGPEEGLWICLDFVDVVVHVFEGATRAHYDLEHLWGDAPQVALPPAGPASPTGAPSA